jgi:hypothetical protein
MYTLESDVGRSQVLRELGASGPVVDELLAYTDNPFARFSGPVPVCPLPDEAHVERWKVYEAEAHEVGAFAALQRRFVQLRFPIREGMSREESYREATLGGRFDEADAFAPGLQLADPSRLELMVHATPAGSVPFVVAGSRADFVALVQAFTDRNEPVPVPHSMGACIVTGLNNWDRIACHRRAWEQSDAGPAAGGNWSDEFRRLTANREMYQDRFIILSRGPYSATSAADVGLSDAEWLARSLEIRRVHEVTHYFTFRVFGAMRNNLFDELVADFAGLVGAFGSYRPDLAARFLGLEAFPRYRIGGRLENYRGNPPLSPDAFEVLARVAWRAISHLADFGAAAADHLSEMTGIARATFVLARLTLEQLASSDMTHLASVAWTSE